MLFKHSITTLLPMLESGQFSDYKLQCGDESLEFTRVSGRSHLLLQSLSPELGGCRQILKGDLR